MEWVETTAKTVDEAREAALDRLGVAGDEAEFDIVEEPRPGLFGRVRGQARVRARIRPTPVRPKQERRRRGREKPKRTAAPAAGGNGDAAAEPVETSTPGSNDDGAATARSTSRSRRGSSDSARSTGGSATTSPRQERPMSTDDRIESDVTPEQVGEAAVAFMTGLTEAFGYDATTDLHLDGIEIEISVTGEELGLLVGPGGRTLTAVQDLARVAAQRRLGDHDTRLRVDVARYRERRNAALAKFAVEVAESVRSSGSARSLEPMSSADRKVIHDVLNEQEGVSSRSEGEDPNRRIVVVPA